MIFSFQSDILNLTRSGFIHVTADGNISFFLMAK